MGWACSAGGNADFTSKPPQQEGGAGSGGSLALDGNVEASFHCKAGEWGCWSKTRYQCAQDGLGRTNEQVCPDACDATLGCVVCAPGSRQCQGAVSMVCAPDASGWIFGRDCAEWSTQCGSNGYCADACGQAEVTFSYVGCEYWPVPLANTAELDSTLFDYRVVVANPNKTEATVTVTRGTKEVYSGKVPANGLQEVKLPWIDGQSFGIPGSDWKSIVVKDGAYRLRSNLPVTVSQFNPFEYKADGPNGATFSYTNDATLLLPTHVLTGDYVNVTYLPFTRATGTSGGFPTPPTFIKYPNYMAIVGVTPEAVDVTVTVSGYAAAETGGRFLAAGPGDTLQFQLARGEVAHVAAAPPPNCKDGRPGYVRKQDCTMGLCDYLDTCGETEFDLTGSRVSANRPVEVFGGHVCAYVPYFSEACDHMETQLSPIQTWGKQFVSRPMTDQGGPGDNLVRVVAAFDDTQVTVDPPQAGIGSQTLGANQWMEFMASTPFVVSGSKAIQVGQFLVGQYYSDPPAARGDPGMTVLVPSEQYRADYIFVTPTSYNETTNGQNYVLIVRPPGVELTLDGQAVSGSWEAIGGKEVAIVALPGGTHTIMGKDKFGMIAYGLGSFTSYAYPAGLDLKRITDVVK
jgi:hypothetical protein